MVSATNLPTVQEETSSRRSSLASVSSAPARSPSLVSLTSADIYNVEDGGPKTLKSELFVFSPRIDVDQSRSELEQYVDQSGEVSLLVKKGQIEQSIDPIEIHINKLKLALKDNQESQGSLRQSKSSLLMLFSCSARREFRAQMDPLKETEKRLKETLSKAQLELLRRKAESSHMQNKAAWLTRIRIDSELSKPIAKQLLDYQSRRELRTNVRYEALDQAKTKDEYLKEIAETKTRVLTEFSSQGIDASTLQLKSAQAAATKQILANKRTIIDAQMNALMHQQHTVKRATSWYMIRPMMQKIELQQIKFAIRAVKSSDKALAKLERANEKESKRLLLKTYNLVDLIERLNALAAQPEETRNRPSFQKKIAKLKEKQSLIENDISPRGLCFCLKRQAAESDEQAPRPQSEQEVSSEDPSSSSINFSASMTQNRANEGSASLKTDTAGSDKDQ